MAKIDYKNFYTVYYWMSKLQLVTEDKDGNPKKDRQGSVIVEPLSGVAKEIYAIVFRFSHGKNGCCTMSYTYLEELTGASRSTVIRNIKRLEKNGLIHSATLTLMAEKEDAKTDNIVGKNYRVNAEVLENLQDRLGIQIEQLKAIRENELKPTGWNDYRKDGDSKEDAPKKPYWDNYFERHKKK